MKVVPLPNPVLAAPKATPTAKADRSFAALLESGVGAGAVLAQRALGFAETGVLGLHFARVAPEAEEIPDHALAERSPDDLPALPAQEPVTGRKAAPLPASSLQQSPEPPEALRLPLEAPSALTKTAVGAARGVPERSSAAVQGKGDLGRPLSARMRMPDPAPARRRSPSWVDLSGDEAELVVTVAGLEAENGPVSNLVQTARSLASQYGMKIKRLLFKPAGRLGTLGE